MSSQRPGPMAELWAVPEFGAFLASAPLLSLAPRGDGHAVLVLPGLAGSDRSTEPLRWLLRQLGYRTHGWGLGTNEGTTERVALGLRDRLNQLSDRYGAPVSLVGWSLGGVHARLMARWAPLSVRQVITMGTPIRSNRAVAATLAVPSTSIYSRGDAIVDYRLSIDEPGPAHENVEVRGSHLGLGHNPAVLYVVADRLALQPGRWKPFRPPAPLRMFYPAESERSAQEA